MLSRWRRQMPSSNPKPSTTDCRQPSSRCLIVNAGQARNRHWCSPRAAPVERFTIPCEPWMLFPPPAPLFFQSPREHESYCHLSETWPGSEHAPWDSRQSKGHRGLTINMVRGLYIPDMGRERWQSSELERRRAPNPQIHVVLYRMEVSFFSRGTGFSCSPQGLISNKLFVV